MIVRESMSGHDLHAAQQRATEDSKLQKKKKKKKT